MGASKAKKMDAKLLGKRIKLARVESDLTQAELAKQIHALQKSISGYETGMATPSLETLLKIANALKKSPGYFLDELGANLRKSSGE